MTQVMGIEVPTSSLVDVAIGAEVFGVSPELADSLREHVAGLRDAEKVLASAERVGVEAVMHEESIVLMLGFSSELFGERKTGKEYNRLMGALPGTKQVRSNRRRKVIRDIQAYVSAVAEREAWDALSVVEQAGVAAAVEFEKAAAKAASAQPVTPTDAPERSQALSPAEEAESLTNEWADAVAQLEGTDLAVAIGYMESVMEQHRKRLPKLPRTKKTA